MNTDQVFDDIKTSLLKFKDAVAIFWLFFYKVFFFFFISMYCNECIEMISGIHFKARYILK